MGGLVYFRNINAVIREISVARHYGNHPKVINKGNASHKGVILNDVHGLTIQISVIIGN